MNDYTPLTDITERLLDIESQTVTDYAYGSFDHLKQNKNLSGVHIDITANIGYLDYYSISADKIRDLTREFTQRVNDEIEFGYISQSVDQSLIYAKRFAADIETALNESIDFLTGLHRYRNQYPDYHIEFRSYDEQIKTVHKLLQSTLDKFTNRLTELSQ